LNKVKIKKEVLYSKSKQQGELEESLKDYYSIIAIKELKEQ